MTPAGALRRAPFPRELLGLDVEGAAEQLLGALLVRDGGTGRRIGRIVEVEAYGGPEDGASHARFAGSPRRAAMAAPPGSAYVYLVYGMHTCLNVVTGPAGHPSAVLVRAVSPIAGIEAIRAARRTRPSGSRDPARLDRIPDVRLASGPALVAAAFDVDGSLNGIDLCAPDGSLRLEIELDRHGAPVRQDASRIVRGPRIGVAYADEPWRSLPRRLFLAGDLAVSRGT